MTHPRSLSHVGALASFLVLLACSSENAPGTNGSGGSSGTSTGGRGGAGGRGGGGGTAGSGGMTGGAGGSSAGTGGTTGGSGGNPGTGGSGGSSGSTGTGGGAGGAASGGAGGVGGAGAGGTGGGAGGTGGGAGDGGRPEAGGDTPPASGTAIAGKLHRYLRTLRCVRPNPQDTRRSCFASDEDANRHDMFAFGGDPSVTYEVTIRVRGNVEPRGYTGGALQDPMNPWFYVGGTPGGPNDNALYNQYKIIVAEPRQVYYLNANSQGILPRSARDHDTWKINYTGKLRIKGGAMVDIANEDRPSGMNSNFLMVKVEGVPMELLNQEPSGFPGQFFYLEVESVVPATN